MNVPASVAHKKIISVILVLHYILVSVFVQVSLFIVSVQKPDFTADRSTSKYLMSKYFIEIFVTTLLTANNIRQTL